MISGKTELINFVNFINFRSKIWGRFITEKPYREEEGLKTSIKS